MHRTELCDIPECGRPAPYGHVCYQCVDDTKQWLEHITDGDADRLLAIARRQEKPVGLPTQSKNTSKGSGQDAINISAWTLHQQITQTWPNMMNTLHRNPDAAKTIHQIEQGVTRALEMVRTPEPQPDSTKNREKQKMLDQIPSQPPKQLAAYIRDRLGIYITGKQIQKWAERGHIAPRTTNKHGQNCYHPLDALNTLNNIRPKKADNDKQTC